MGFETVEADRGVFTMIFERTPWKIGYGWDAKMLSISAGINRS